MDQIAQINSMLYGTTHLTSKGYQGNVFSSMSNKKTNAHRQRSHLVTLNT
jgi:hypothetical protein